MNNEELGDLLKESNKKADQINKYIDKVIITNETIEIHLNRKNLDSLSDDLKENIIELLSKF